MLSLSNKLSLNSGNNVDSKFTNLYSLAFDGVDDFLSMADSDVFTPNNSGANRGFSVSFWVKTASASEPIIAKAGINQLGTVHYEYYVVNDFSNRLKIIFYSGDTNTNSIDLRLDDSLIQGTWYHASFSWNLGATNADITAHLNGVKHSVADGNATWGTTGTFTSVSNTTNPLLVGRHATSYGNVSVDEFAIFDDVLTDADSVSIYNKGNPTSLSSIPNLIGWWRNGDNIGTSSYPIIRDFSSNSNIGTMYNMDSTDITTDVPHV